MAIKQVNIPQSFMKNSGMALVMVLVIIGALMVLGTALVTFAVNETLIANYNSRDIRLYYLVEGGAEIGIAILKEDFYHDQDIDRSMAGGMIKITFSDEYIHFHDGQEDEKGEEYYQNKDHIRFVRCIGTLGEYSKTMTVAMEIDFNEQVTIKRWYRAFPKHF